MTPPPSSLKALAEHLNSAAAGNVPSSLLRQKGIEALSAGLDWPAGKAEAWRHTPLSAWQGQSWRRLGELPDGGPDQAIHGTLPKDADAQVVADAIGLGVIATRADSPTLYFVDGRFVPQSSFVPKEGPVSVLPLDAAREQKHQALVKIGALSLHESEAFAALNTASSSFGALVEVAANHQATSSIEVVFLTTRAGDGAVVQPRLLVVAHTGCAVGVTESHVHLGDEKSFNNAVTEVFVGRGAHVTHTVFQAGSARALDLSHVGAEVLADGQLTLATLDTGGRLVRRGVNVVLAEAGAEATLLHLSLAQKEQHHDTQSNVRHAAPHTQSRQQFRAIARECATAVFGGMVEVKPKAQKIDAQQMSRGLIEGQKGAQVLLKPQLVIDADDVKCSHGATVGQLDEDAIFYLESRGLSADDARQLLHLAFLGEALGLLPPAASAPLRFEAARWLGIDPGAALAVSG